MPAHQRQFDGLRSARRPRAAPGIIRLPGVDREYDPLLVGELELADQGAFFLPEHVGRLVDHQLGFRKPLRQVADAPQALGEQRQVRVVLALSPRFPAPEDHALAPQK